MSFLATCVGYLTPIFIILSPILSYGDQAVSMHRKKTSAGFSLDIPLIMLIASLFRYFLPSCLLLLQMAMDSAGRQIRDTADAEVDN
jgi:hypothetical protein